MSDDRPEPEAAQPSGTVTLVFTDIEGSTRLLEQLGVDGYREALAEPPAFGSRGVRALRRV
jgi:class 3 adenylate cyclase